MISSTEPAVKGASHDSLHPSSPPRLPPRQDGGEGEGERRAVAGRTRYYTRDRVDRWKRKDGTEGRSEISTNINGEKSAKAIKEMTDFQQYAILIIK